MKSLLWLVLLVSAAVVPAQAQVQIDKRKPLPAGSTVSVSNSFGSVTVTAWDKNEVWVKGTLAPGAMQLAFETNTSEDEDENGKAVKRTYAEIQVETPNSWTFESDDDSDYRSTLEIYVPKSASIQMQSVNASLTATGMTGDVEAETVNGAIKISGGTGEVRLQTLTGAVDYEGAAKAVSVDSVSGAVKLGTLSGEARIRSVTGNIAVRTAKLKELSAETTLGSVTVEGSIAPEGEWRIETFSGAVSLAFSETPLAHFRLKTAQGEIVSSLGPKPRREERFNPFRVLEFQTGEDTSVEVETYSGAITLKAGAAKP